MTCFSVAGGVSGVLLGLQMVPAGKVDPLLPLLLDDVPELLLDVELELELELVEAALDAELELLVADEALETEVDDVEELLVLDAPELVDALELLPVVSPPLTPPVVEVEEEAGLFEQASANGQIASETIVVTNRV